ncbi:hypothetical protein [Croceibacterium ferulae]|uniref:hypothetical protein n=1 Tax=Croceibacterium ferulae TaxID=1854641 RepID=UPI000EAEE215|nr:hypothetical protein [Croceibacterium ferulae]
MADQVNGSGDADRKDSAAETNGGATSKAGTGQSPDNKDAGSAESSSPEQTESDKTEVLEEAQRDAAKEREENRGYQ